MSADLETVTVRNCIFTNRPLEKRTVETVLLWSSVQLRIDRRMRGLTVVMHSGISLTKLREGRVVVPVLRVTVSHSVRGVVRLRVDAMVGHMGAVIPKASAIDLGENRGRQRSVAGE